jgi:putative transposase
MYQGPFKSFPVQEDDHFYSLCRYVERNALRAKLARRAEHWRWGNLWRMTAGDRESRAWLSAWPLPGPRRWVEWVNEPQTEAELAAFRRCVFGGAEGPRRASGRGMKFTRRRLDPTAQVSG